MSTRITCILTATLALACADEIGFVDEGLDPGDEGKIANEELGGGVLRTTVDASDERAWVYLDLDSASEQAEGADSWDLGLRRFEIIVDGGISGEAGVEVAILDGAEFESLSAVPADAHWITDAVDGDDEDEEPDLAFFDWYDYDITTHLLRAKDRVYLVRSSEGAVFKLKIIDYYSTSGSSGFSTFDWAPLG